VALNPERLLQQFTAAETEGPQGQVGPQGQGGLQGQVGPAEGELLILEMREDRLPVFKALRQTRRAAYLVFVARDLGQLLPALQLNLMPSGLVPAPLDAHALGEVLANVYNDYLNRWVNPPDVLTVNIGADIYKVPLGEIVYVEALEKKISLVTKNKCLSFYARLATLEEKLQGRFTRCHRSFLVNLAQVREVRFGEGVVVMANGARVPVSRTYRGNLREGVAP
jgi:DNA-binding LytR/AlgR family response regulator